MGWQGMKVMQSFIITTTKVLFFPSRIRTSSPQWTWAHHQASAPGLKPRWWKTGCKMYDEAGGLWGIVLHSTVTIQSLADEYKAEGQVCCIRIKSQTPSCCIILVFCTVWILCLCLYNLWSLISLQWRIAGVTLMMTSLKPETCHLVCSNQCLAVLITSVSCQPLKLGAVEGSSL